MDDRDAALLRYLPDDRGEALDIVRMHDVGADLIQDMAKLFAGVTVPGVRDSPAELVDGRPLVTGLEALVKPPTIVGKKPIYIYAAHLFEAEALIARAARYNRDTVSLRRERRRKHLRHDLGTSNYERRVEAVHD
jgi:hypothetical protein